LVWFVRDQVRDGLDRPNGDLLAAVEHRADREAVAPLPTEILAAFDSQSGPADQDEDRGEAESRIRQGQVMVAAQTTVVDTCVRDTFLPDLAERRTQRA
jgi:hypothetical protein